MHMNRFAETESVILRYAEHINGLDLQWLQKASIREGAEVIQGKEYKGVELTVLDLSTYAATGTFKSSAACVTVAECLRRGVEQFVSQSSGNTANALALYATTAKIRVMILYPASSTYKIQPDLADSEFVRFVEVAGSEEDIKKLTREYSELTRIPWLPSADTQVESNKLRAYFLADYEAKTKLSFDWHAQALSSGWGIFGFYKGIEEIRGTRHSLKQPHLLGVQQEAVCPFFRYLNSAKHEQPFAKMIEPTLFRSTPTQNMLETMKGIVEQSDGRIVVLTNKSYELYEGLAVQLITDFGIRLAKIQIDGERTFVEKAGIITMAATLREIDFGRIAEGNNVLICLTGGCGVDRELLFEPPYSIEPGTGLEALRRIGDEFFSE
jgi:threonine synthase